MISDTAPLFIRARSLITVWVMMFASVTLASELSDFVAACTSSSNLEADICECAGRKAKGEMSPQAFDFLVATLTDDESKAAALRGQLSMEEAIKAGTFMVRGPAQCAREKATR